MFTADFETNTKDDNVSVWAYALCEIGNIENFIYGNNINDFMKFCFDKKHNYKIYFHNLKFDGTWIFTYLLENGFTCIKDKKDKKDKTFTCLISEMGVIYSIVVYYSVKSHHINSVTFYDSMNLLNFSVDEIAKKLKLPIQKLKIDYNLLREDNHKLSELEIAYIKNDVTIMAMALDYFFKQGLTKITIGSNALHFYKELQGNFNHYFPELEYETDKLIRKSYKGGFTYLNPIYKDKITKNGIVLDVNSLYPYIMYDKFLPFGKPIYFEGRYQKDNKYNLYIQVLSCSFEIKKGKIPTLQIKNNLYFKPNEYLTSSNDEIVTLTLTNVDLNLFLENYNVTDLTYHYGFKFKSIKGLFKNYIDIWSQNKINAKKDNNNVLYLTSKLMLNSLYGKFGTNPHVKSKYPTLEDGIIKYKSYPEELKKSVYIPMATFITAYAREKTIRTSQKIKDYTINKYGDDMYIYSDTDSIHTTFTNIDELKEIIDIDDYKLGYWKPESTFVKGKFLRQKCYIEEDDNGIIHCTIAGLPKKLGSKITFENFGENLEIKGKLVPKKVKGGVLLKETTFTIK